MPDFQPAELAQIAQGNWHGGTPARIKGFTFDTRRAGPDDCFIALKSEHRDGHDFVADAAAQGATAAITARPVGAEFPQLIVADPLTAMGAIATDVRHRFSKPVVGITGSCGKTSTKEMLRLLLGESATHATAGNWNNRIGVPMTLFDLDPEQHEFAVIEAGINQPGEMELLGSMIEADLTILTHIGPAHLELLGSLEGVAGEKAKLAERSKSGAPIVLPAEALHYPAYARLAHRCIAVEFDGEASPAGVRQAVACRVAHSFAEGRTELKFEEATYVLRSTSAGMARNAALALVAARTLGLGAELLAERLPGWSPDRTRGRVVSTPGHYYYVDCYNANPSSMIDALEAFQSSAPEDLPRCYILGAMNELGASAPDLHASVGERLRLRPDDRAILIGPEAMTAAYFQGIKAGGAVPEQIKFAENIAGIESMVADFKGALFLKGSRAYGLEKLLPASLL